MVSLKAAAISVIIGTWCAWTLPLGDGRRMVPSAFAEHVGQAAFFVHLHHARHSEAGDEKQLVRSKFELIDAGKSLCCSRLMAAMAGGRSSFPVASFFPFAGGSSRRNK